MLDKKQLLIKACNDRNKCQFMDLANEIKDLTYDNNIVVNTILKNFADDVDKDQGQKLVNIDLIGQLCESREYIVNLDLNLLDQNHLKKMIQYLNSGKKDSMEHCLKQFVVRALLFKNSAFEVAEDKITGQGKQIAPVDMLSQLMLTQELKDFCQKVIEVKKMLLSGITIEIYKRDMMKDPIIFTSDIINTIIDKLMIQDINKLIEEQKSESGQKKFYKKMRAEEFEEFYNKVIGAIHNGANNEELKKIKDAYITNNAKLEDVPERKDVHDLFMPLYDGLEKFLGKSSDTSVIKLLRNHAQGYKGSMEQTEQMFPVKQKSPAFHKGF